MREGANLPIMRITGLLADRPFFPATIHSGLELSTVVQGTGELKGEDVNLHKYVHLITKKVFEKRSKPLGLPSASQKVLIAQCTLNKTNVSLLASVIKTVKEHKISVEGVKRLKMGSLATLGLLTKGSQRAISS